MENQTQKKALRECRVVGSYLGMWRKSSSSRAYVCVCVVHSFLSFHPHWRIGVSDESKFMNSSAVADRWSLDWICLLIVGIHPVSLSALRVSVSLSVPTFPCPSLFICVDVELKPSPPPPTPLYSMSLFECTPVQKEAFIIFNVPNTKSCQQRMNWFRPSRVEATMENPKNRTTNSTMECQFTNLIHWWFGMFFLVCSIVFLFVWIRLSDAVLNVWTARFSVWRRWRVCWFNSCVYFGCRSWMTITITIRDRKSVV